MEADRQKSWIFLNATGSPEVTYTGNYSDAKGFLKVTTATLTCWQRETLTTSFICRLIFLHSNFLIKRMM